MLELLFEIFIFYSLYIYTKKKPAFLLQGCGLKPLKPNLLIYRPAPHLFACGSGFSGCGAS